MILTNLALKYGTEKLIHTYFNKSYLDIYEHYFHPRRDSATHILEFGVFKGCSIRVWHEYFKSAEIVGVDIDPYTIEIDNRVRIVKGNQNDPELLKHIPQFFDIIIDDCSHIVTYIIETFWLWWPRVKPGGLYIIEDLQLSYIDWTFARDCSYPGMLHTPKDVDLVNKRTQLDEKLFSILIKSMDSMGLHGSAPNDVSFVHFYPCVAIIGKAP